MNTLVQLIQALDTTTTHQKTLLKGNEKQLFQRLKSGKIATLKDSLNHFFDGEEGKLNEARHLAWRLKKKLIDGLFLSNGKAGKDFASVYFACEKKSIAAKYLIIREKKEAGYQLAREAIVTAQKYHFSQIILELAQKLRLHYATVLLDFKKAVEYDQICQKYLHVVHAEDFAESAFCQITAHFRQKKHLQEDWTKISEVYEKDIKNHFDTYKTYKLGFYYFYFVATRCELQGNYSAIVENGKNALSFFKGLEFQVPMVEFTFLFRQANALLHLAKYSEALEEIDRCLDYPLKTINQHLALQMKSAIGFQSGEYQICQNTLEIAKEKGWPDGPIGELWSIHKAYTAYFIKRGLVQANVKRFRLGKVMNEVPTYNQDKRGQNITILIAQILHHLADHKRGKIIDKTDALKRYKGRHLKGSDTLRSNLFISMLILLEKSQFNKTAFLRHTAGYRAQLEANPARNFVGSVEIELVPYEVLVEEVLEWLD